MTDKKELRVRQVMALFLIPILAMVMVQILPIVRDVIAASLFGLTGPVADIFSWLITFIGFLLFLGCVWLLMRFVETGGSGLLGD